MESIWVDSEVAVVFVEPTTELVAVVVTLGEMEVGGRGEGLLTLGQIN